MPECTLETGRAPTQGGRSNMHARNASRLAAAAAAVLSAAALGGLTAVTASAWEPPSPTLYVNGSSSGYGGPVPVATPSRRDGDRRDGHRHRGGSCATAAYTTIGAAVVAATTRGTRIVVCPGTYREDVTVGTPLIIEGIQATLDATGQPNGFTLKPSAAGTSVSGFTIENAVGEGVLALSTSDVSIVNDT